MARTSREETALAELIVTSLAAIEKLPKSSHMFVKVDRVRRRKSMDPTEHQSDLYNWIKRRGFVKWELTLGMHWGMLGGLMARGLVIETTQDGEKGIVAR